MDNFNNSINITMQAIEFFSQAYSYCYTQLKENNIVLPAPDRIVSIATSSISYILANSPGIIQQFYNTLSQLPINSNNNLVIIVLMLVILYIVFCLIMITLRGMYRLVYGFVKFSFFVTSIAGVIYVTQQYLSGTLLTGGTSSSDQNPTRSFR